jgi:universal stress protein A
MPRILMIQKILVPTDYSEISQRALGTALGLAEKFGARVDVLHVWSAPYFGPEYDDLALGEQQQSLFSLIRERAHEEMSRFVQEVGVPPGVPVETHVVSGDPAHAVLAWQEEHAPDLLVVGTHGRTGARYLLLGSVAARLVQLSRCPVLTVPGTASPPA